MILALLGLAGCGESRAEVESDPRPISWSVAEAADAQVKRRLSGVVRARQRTILAFEVPGRVASVRVDDGDRFRRGDVLATLEMRTFTLGVREARAALDEARATLRESDDALARSRELLERGAETRAAFLRAEAARARAVGRVHRAEASLETALERKRDAVLRAPFDGRVASRRIEPSETVTIGRPVLHVHGDEGFEVVASAPETVVGELSLGSVHRLRFPGRSRVLPARLTQIAAEPEARQAYPITLAIEASAPFLRSGLTSEVELALPIDTPTAVSIPVEAFRSLPGVEEAEDRTVVFVFDASAQVVREREVGLAELEADRALVTAGLEPGEIVADRGVAFLRDGQAVRRIGVGAARFEGEDEAPR